MSVTPIRYLTRDDLITIYNQITAEKYAIPDQGKLDIIMDTPQKVLFGQEIYEDEYSKAAIIFETIINLHLFIDGNKRMALQTTELFLRINDIGFDYDEEGFKFLLSVATMKECYDESTRTKKRKRHITIKNYIKAHSSYVRCERVYQRMCSVCRKYHD